MINKHKMTVGLVFDDSLDRPDGVQQQVRLIGDWLGRQGHDVHYLVGETKEFRPESGQVHSLSKNIRVRANQNSLSLPLPGSRRRVRRVLDANDFDILHVMLPYSPWLGRNVVKAARRRRVPLVGTFHTYPASAWQRIGSYLYGQLIQRQLRRFQAITSVSAPTAGYVKRYFGMDSTIVPNAVELKRFAGAKPIKSLRKGAKHLVMYMNRLDERKGAKYLILAVAELPERLRRELRVLVCGRGPLKSELEVLVKRLELEDIVSFPGFVAEADKPKYLASADVAVYPATGGEAFGIVLLEAMAAGAVTLGGNNAGYASVLSPVGESLFVPEDTATLAEKLETLLSDKQTRENLDRHQAELVATYDIAVVGTRLQRMYAKAIAAAKSI